MLALLSVASWILAAQPSGIEHSERWIFALRNHALFVGTLPETYGRDNNADVLCDSLFLLLGPFSPIEVRVDMRRVMVAMRLWIPSLVLLGCATALFYADRRRRIPAGCCRRCGYDLRGAVSDRCSECGTMIASGVVR